MTNQQLDELVAEMNREIEIAPLATPGPGESVTDCCYSRTGWAIAREDGQCTCKPTLPPVAP